MLFRVFPLLAGARLRQPGGALYVARERQGTGRHDNPDRYGALYASGTPESAVAERIQGFRGQTLTDADLHRPDGLAYALASIDDAGLGAVVDLDDPAELVARSLRPSAVATRRRLVTQEIARALFDEGVDGFRWWSALEASWPNATLFAERSARRLKLEGRAEVLSTAHPALRTAADALGIRLA